MARAAPHPGGVLDEGPVVGNRGGVASVALQAGPVGDPRAKERRRRRDADLGEGGLDLRRGETRRYMLAVEFEGLEGTDEQDLVQLGRPGTRVREDVEEGADEGARVLVVLHRERPPLRHQPGGGETLSAQLVEVLGVEVHDAGRRGGRGLERDDVVKLRTPQEFVPSVAAAPVETRVRRCTKVALEEVLARTTDGRSSATTRAGRAINGCTTSSMQWTPIRPSRD
jgi:hypothetical protein